MSEKKGIGISRANQLNGKQVINLFNQNPLKISFQACPRRPNQSSKRISIPS